ncbi:MAG: hypothetical protein N2Z81_07655 [Hydrogenothermaceae bacterium]|nr:hypothetical protein [Hydrogenothermaceae bacterium]
MDKTPYAEEFLLNQLELIVKSIKKPVYKEEVNRFLKNEEWFNLFKIAKDKKSRNYKNGILERVTALGSLALCLYDNYPIIDIDLILSAVVIAGFKDAIGKKPVYDYLKNDEIKSIVFKKSRKKPKVEYFLFDEIVKIDSRVYNYLLL